MKKYTKQQILQIIVSCAKDYKQFLCGKHFLIIYRKSNQIQYTNVGFRDYNFLHLTGVKISLPSRKFFAKAISNRLSINDFSVDSYGKVQQKINVLPYLAKLLYNKCMVGDFINNGIRIQADYFIGDTKAVVSVGFRQGTTTDIPVTLYNEDVRKLTSPTCRVLGVYSKRFDEDSYNECVYHIKDSDTVVLPNNIRALIK